jgi:methylated-DNA-[protein]-cysteine S-methyltransferase
MAKVLGSSPRAIGQALRRNPFAPIVPCHRIVASTGSLTGFGGETDQKALDKKKSLLAKENVKVVANSVIPSNVVEEDDLDRIWQAVIAK